jgi:hypothetical protein
MTPSTGDCDLPSDFRAGHGGSRRYQDPRQCRPAQRAVLSYEHACKLEAQLQAEVAELLKLAEAADAADVRAMPEFG